MTRKRNNHLNKLHYEVYYINLDRAKARRVAMEAEFRNHGVKFKRIRAVDGRKIQNIVAGVIGKIKYSNICEHKGLKEEVACSLSHLNAILHAYRAELEHVIIFEDDISLAMIPSWEVGIDSLTRSLPAGWGILQLSCIRPEIVLELLKRKGPFTKKRRGFKNEKYYGAGAYIISRKGMRRLLDRYYRKGRFVLNWYIPNADGLLYDIEGSYIYNRPLFLTKDEIFNSQIRPGRNSWGIQTAKILRAYFRKKLKSKV